ncbi:hypothetical protein EW146_g7592 [Bondarzewia mesenterica]|uniref:HSF-type DNA-binding domain-containing protein n=1 Tax=Bondarzewia mesenterica TaxID=1095465 RepID=A0A4S4LKI4_9AGAM|nr:hypothetical protein EW146_g7592 [Bondarzewia mesenterica]
MEQPGPYSGLQPRQPQLFQSPQLPPPSQLHLPIASSFSRSNTLPPIPNLAPNPQSRYPPASYHPSLQSNTLPPLPSSSSPPSQLPWPSHRTSASREDLYSPTRQQDSKPKPYDRESSNPHTQDHKESEDGMPPTSDFVKKLYKMLEDQSFHDVVSWGPHGDCFVVKDMNEFTKSILPRMFKHSNFASFVRQLNKYDFHKVKNTDDNQFGEHSWTFRHPDFHADRRDALENIKRKVPAARKSLPSRGGANGGSPSPSTTAGTVEALQAQVERLVQSQDDMAAHIRNLENNYQNVLTEMVNFQRNMAQQDGLMQNLISYFLQMENGKLTWFPSFFSPPSHRRASLARTYRKNERRYDPHRRRLRPGPQPVPAHPRSPAMMGSYPETDVARASLFQMNEISRRAEVAGMSFGSNGNSNNNANSNANASGSGSAASASNNNNNERSSPPSIPARPPSSASRIMAAAVGLMAPPPNANAENADAPLSRQDALAAMEELQRHRPQSAQAGSVEGSFAGPSTTAASSSSSDPSASTSTAPTSGSEPFILPSSSTATSSQEGLSAMQQYVQQNSTVAHEGLQVFTLGHLLPKSSVDDQNGNWSFDPSTLNDLLPLPLSGAR